MSVTADYLRIVEAAEAAGIDYKKAREIAERAVGIPERCSYEGVEGHRCERVARHRGPHEWETGEYKSVLTANA